jgi:hypothetical protein
MGGGRGSTFEGELLAIRARVGILARWGSYLADSHWPPTRPRRTPWSHLSPGRESDVAGACELLNILEV